MTEDWSAVAKAINRRVTELGLRQRELAERAQISQAIVRELQRNTVNRRRSARTLDALSIALQWHPQHLSAVLHGQRPREAGEPIAGSPEEVPTRLAAIEGQLRDITERLDELNANLAAGGNVGSQNS